MIAVYQAKDKDHAEQILNRINTHKHHGDTALAKIGFYATAHENGKWYIEIQHISHAAMKKIVELARP